MMTKTWIKMVGTGGVLWLAALGLLLTVACGGESSRQPQPTATPTIQPAPAASPTTTAAPLRLMRTNPEKGPVGTPFTVSGDGFGPGKELDVQWTTWEGAYDTEIKNNKVVFYDRQFTPVRVSLGRAVADAQGRVAANFMVPDDYGEIHDIYLTADGVDVGKGGFFVSRSFTFSPNEGPIGTPVTLTVKGLGVGAFNSTLALRYDNTYTGWISATTTRGTAVVRFRAAGPVGKHLVEAVPASHLTPYINVQQSSVGYLEPFRAWFNVTADKGALPEVVELPDSSRVNYDSITRTTVGLVPLTAPSARGTVMPALGPVGAKVNLEISSLPAGPVDLVWATVTGSDVFGWNLSQELLSETTVGVDGTLKAAFEVPDGLGGWHAIWVKRGDDVLTEAPFFVERSLVTVAPTKVKEGEIFQVRLKGVGWTELDNGVSVTYDNAFVGYGCGFSSRGDVTLYLVATGGLGTHLIDLYPMIYDGGNGKWPWQYNMPQLTALEDHPSLGRGYRLPIFRVAIEVVP